MSDTFWSRRRAAVAEEARTEAEAQAAAALAEEQAVFEAQSDDEILAQFDLPDPDTLKQGDDFTAFMAKAVPDRIRRRALRTLWSSNPVLANVDHLVEYGEDYTDAATVVENLQTAYQVGKGMLKHVEELARQAAEADAPAPAEEAPEEDEEVVLAEAEPETPPAPAAEPEPRAPAPRRMTFRTEETA